MQEFFETKSDDAILFTINRGSSISEVATIIGDEYSFPVLLDKNLSVSQDYGITHLPTTFIIDKRGIIRIIKIGSYQSINEMESDLLSIQ